MKVKISVTLSKGVLASIDRLARGVLSRSALIEQVLRQYLRSRANKTRRKTAHPRDLVRIDKAAAKLNAEASDVLSYHSKHRSLES
jgi:metal-responsive CopG/Arc/MetJ family transcriptional regulator